MAIRLVTSRDPKRVICIKIYLDANISKTNRDQCLVPKDHQYKIAYGESNGHMIDDPDMFGAQYFENGWTYRLVTVAHL